MPFEPVVRVPCPDESLSRTSLALQHLKLHALARASSAPSSYLQAKGKGQSLASTALVALHQRRL